MTSGRALPARGALPPAVIGLVIALCSVLLLKWLAVVALAAAGVVVLARRWRRTGPGRREPVPGTTPAPARPRPADASDASDTSETSVASAPSDPLRVVVAVGGRGAGRDACSWCGLPGGHRAVDGTLRRPRHVHAAR